MINTLKIKAKIVELGLTQKDIASALKIALPTVSQKINNIRPMTLDEADKIAFVLQIDESEYATYFFATKIA